MKKQVFLVLALSALLLTSCGSKPSGPEVEDLGTKDFHTELQQAYIDDVDFDKTDDVIDGEGWKNIKNYVPFVDADNPTGADRDQLLGNVSTPNAIKLEFDEVEDSDSYFVQIADNVEFENAKQLEVTNKYYDLYNTELGKEYYFRASAYEGGLDNAKIRKFRVSNDAPRNVYVDGVINFRDIGGWESSLVEGARIKQGLYYRCAQFNQDNSSSSNPRLNITEKGLETIKELNIRVDIDMRDRPLNMGTTENPLSVISTEDHEVKLLDAHIASGTESTRFSGFADVYSAIFEKIENADQAPIALHCTYGADRTGIASFFLLAVLGASENDCGRDYSFTRFAGARKVWHEDEFDGWVEGVKAYEDRLPAGVPENQKFAEEMKLHLMSKGISEDRIETIREKFIPGYTRPAAA